jgi:hypothetical protein
VIVGGSGLLVGPRHVLTALHVLVDDADDAFGRSIADARTASIGEALPTPSMSERFEVFFAASPARTYTARCCDFDRHNDIALLELDGALHGVARPRFAEGSARDRQGVLALGFVVLRGESAPVFRHQTGTASLTTGLNDGGLRLHSDVAYGAQAGFSGGPVFLADDGAAPRLVGMSRTGGDGFDHGKIVACDLLVSWLRGRLPEAMVAPDSADARSEILARGYEPFHRIAPGKDFLFAAIDGTDRDEPRQTFVALAPLSRATQANSATAGAVDADRPAHFPSAARTTEAIERSSREHGVRFRLPTMSEITRLGTLGRAVSSRPLLGEPLAMRHFVEPDDCPRLPPDGVLEWCATQSDQTIREHRGGALREPTQPPQPAARLVARLAFDVETSR